MVDRLAWSFHDHGRVATEANHVFAAFLDVFFDLAAARIRLVALCIHEAEVCVEVNDEFLVFKTFAVKWCFGRLLHA